MVSTFTVASLYTKPKFEKILLSQIAWHAKDVAVMYSASAVKSVMISCFLEYQVIALVLRVKTLLDVLFLSSSELTQSLSEYPCNLNLVEHVYQTPNSRVPAMYLRIRLAGPLCCFVGFCMNLDIILIANIILGRVCVCVR